PFRLCTQRCNERRNQERSDQKVFNFHKRNSDKKGKGPHQPERLWTLRLVRDQTIYSVSSSFRMLSLTTTETRKQVGWTPLTQIVEIGVRHRRNQKSQQQAERLSADDRHRHRGARARAGALAQSDGQHSGENRNRGHENGPEANVIGLNERFVTFHAALSQGV